VFEAENSPSFHTFFNGLGANDLKARQAQNAVPNGTVAGSAPAQGQVFVGYSQSPNGVAPVQSPGPGDPQDAGDLQLNFEGADVATVCKTILSDILKVNYSIDPRITGTINLASTRPLPKKTLISLLEAALKQVNAVLVVDHDLYKVVPSGEPGTSGPIETSAVGDGFGVTAIPVKYVSPETIAHVLESFAPRPNAVRPDPALGVVFVQGTSSERRSLVETAATIDNDFVKSQTVGVFPLANSAPEQVISELTNIIDSGEGGVTQSLVRLQAMPRMNGILVIAKRKPIFDTVATWIQRLDKQDPTLASVKTYRLRYASAKTVATLLGDLLNGKSGASTTQRNDQDLLQPGGTPTSLQSLPTSANTSSAPSSPGVSGDTSASTRPASTAQPGILGATNVLNPKPASTSTTDQGSAISVGNGKIRITADVDNNALLILASPQDYKIVEAAIRQLDRPAVQVAIEATIAEVTLSDELQYGVQAYLRGAKIGGGFTASTSAATIFPTVPGGNLIFGAQNSPSLVLNALRSRTSVKVLSTPSLVVLDNQSAALQVGDQVAVKTSSVASTLTANTAIVNSIDYKDTGIIMHVKPQVRANGTINLEVTQEISNIIANSGGADGLTPTISQRKVQSSVSVTSGQTVLLAGMISETQSKLNNGLPSVGQFTFLTDLLSQKDNTTSRNELIIFIKPQIIRNGADAEAVAEEFRSQMTSLRDDPTRRAPGRAP
jgi:general secretion pathway protein D